MSMEKLSGKKLLVVGVCDERKNFVFDEAAKYGIKCCSIGSVPAARMDGQQTQYVYYDHLSHGDDITQSDVVADLVKAEFGDVDGCVTFWDASTPLTALLCERLGKAGMPYSGAMAANKKSLTMERVRLACGSLNEQYCTPSYNIASMDDIEKCSKLLRFPAVLKHESGSVGMTVKIVRDLAECREHFSFLQSFDGVEDERKHYTGGWLGKDCVLMELLQGSEHCVDVALFHGELVCAFIRDKGTRNDQHVTIHGVSLMPSVLSSDDQCQVITAVVRCCLALGLDHGVFNLDIMMTESGPKLIEINARMGGFCQPYFVRHCYNVEILHLALMLACDIRPAIAIDKSSLCNGNSSEKKSNGTNGSLSNGSSNSTVFSSETSKASFRYFAPKPLCVMLGRALYVWQNKAALKSTAAPEVLQKLHDEGKLLFLPHETKMREQDYEAPFGTLAVKSQTFDDAVDRMDRLCQDLGLKLTPISFVQNHS